jgi:hypothetical protein
MLFRVLFYLPFRLNGSRSGCIDRVEQNRLAPGRRRAENELHALNRRDKTNFLHGADKDS